MWFIFGGGFLGANFQLGQLGTTQHWTTHALLWGYSEFILSLVSSSPHSFVVAGGEKIWREREREKYGVRGRAEKIGLTFPPLSKTHTRTHTILKEGPNSQALDFSLSTIMSFLYNFFFMGKKRDCLTSKEPLSYLRVVDGWVCLSRRGMVLWCDDGVFSHSLSFHNWNSQSATSSAISVSHFQPNYHLRLNSKCHQLSSRLLGGITLGINICIDYRWLCSCIRSLSFSWTHNFHCAKICRWNLSHTILPAYPHTNRRIITTFPRRRAVVRQKCGFGPLYHITIHHFAPVAKHTHTAHANTANFQAYQKAQNRPQNALNPTKNGAFLTFPRVSALFTPFWDPGSAPHTTLTRPEKVPNATRRKSCPTFLVKIRSDLSAEQSSEKASTDLCVY